MNIKTKFRFPVTRRAIVVWERNGKLTSTIINTPANADMLQMEMLRHRVGYSEIRAVKADPTSDLKDMMNMNVSALVRAMSSI